MTQFKLQTFLRFLAWFAFSWPWDVCGTSRQYWMNLASSNISLDRRNIWYCGQLLANNCRKHLVNCAGSRRIPSPLLLWSANVKLRRLLTDSSAAELQRWIANRFELLLGGRASGAAALQRHDRAADVRRETTWHRKCDRLVLYWTVNQ